MMKIMENQTAAPPTTEASVEAVEEKAKQIIQAGQSPFKRIFKLLLPVLIIGLIVLLVLKVILPLFKKGAPTKEVTLNYWGLWETPETMAPLIAEFQQQHPHIKINYSQQYHKDYRERLQSALARGEGPDIFRFHNTWLAMLKNELTAVPANVFDANTFETIFYPAVKKDLRLGSNYYGIPLMFDCLALFINQEIFQAAAKQPPTTWDGLRTTAAELTVYDYQGKIEIAGVALGETSNVDHWSDILGLMMLQNGVDPAKPDFCFQGGEGETETCPGADALTFYTLFSTTDRVWDKTLPASVYAFATGKAAMVFAPSWQVFNIKAINPQLRFEILPVPQLTNDKVAWASYWVEGVSQKSANQEAAWEFLKFLSQKETLQKFHSLVSQSGRLFGEIPARADMASLYQNHPQISPFLQQASYAQSWYLSSRTWDNGLNEKIIKYFEDAVNAVLAGQNSQESLQIASQGVTQVLNQYQLAP